MRRWIIARIAAWRWRRFTRDFDRRIADARRRHQSVKPILEEKRAFAHAALMGKRGSP